MTTIRLHTYMAYSAHDGQQDAASLVIASTARKARLMCWKAVTFSVDEYIDLAIRRLWDEEILALADQKKLKVGLPHIVDAPECCVACGFWGCGIDKGGKCNDCGEFGGEMLLKLYRDYWSATDVA